MSESFFQPADFAAAVAATANRSASIAALVAALAKAQGEMEAAAKANINPHFKSKYADLASVWDACRGPLSKNGLAVLQPVSADGASVTVTTILAHSSGEWISESLTMTAQQNTPQGVGSAITYGRRYGLSSMVGIAPDDDDGNAASARPTNGHREMENELPPAPAMPAGYDDWFTDMAAVADEGTQALQAAFTKSKVEYRRYLTQNEGRKWEALKAKAAARVPAGVR